MSGSLVEQPSRLGRGRGLALAVLLLTSVWLLSSCSGSSSKAGPSASTSTASSGTTSPSATATLTDRELALQQYRGFWENLTPASRTSASARRAILARYAVEPELSSLL